MEHSPATRIALAAACLASALLTAAVAGAGEVYRWTDENGEVHYSEALPPHLKDKPHDVLNDQGMVVGKDETFTPPPPEKETEEQPGELPRDSSGLPRPKPLYSEAEKQRRMDNFLMLRYRSEGEILDAMDVEIQQLNYDRRLLETGQKSIGDAYRGEIRIAADLQRTGQTVGPEVDQKIRDLKGRLAENTRALAGLQEREDSIRENFKQQLDRYRYLQEQWDDEAGGG